MLKNFSNFLNKRFPILKVATEFLLQSQVEMVYALTTLYNFICLYLGKEDIFEQTDLAGTDRSGVWKFSSYGTYKSISNKHKTGCNGRVYVVDYQRYIAYQGLQCTR